MEDKKEKQKANWNIKPYLAIGLTVFIVILLSLLAFFLIYRYQGLARNWQRFLTILQPVIIGVIIAYLVNPIVKWEEKYLLRWLKPHVKAEKKAKKAARIISIIGALIFIFVILAVLWNMIIPELYTSIEHMVIQLPGQVKLFVAQVESYASEDNEFARYLEMFLNRGVEYFENWAKTDFMPQTRDFLTSLTNGVITVVKLLFNIIIGVMISVYLLMSKETFQGQVKKMIYALLPVKTANVFVETVRKSNQIFGGFISGKILDSAIIGVLCFIGLSILRMPYTVLVSVIVGVTNVIPFFGPYIGAIPSAILIMLTNPVQGIYFVIFILVLQQLDGNVIGPRILGESTGLSSFWVIFSILVGGGLFGFFGMLLGVPVFATLYYLVQRILAYILKKKGLPSQSEVYTDIDRVDPASNQLDYGKKKE